jgi:hypothetical protein
MTDLGYAREKLFVAIETMATGPGDVRERLVDAFMSFHTLREDDFPIELQEDWKWVIGQLTRFGPVLDHNGEIYKGSVEHTMQRIRRGTGSKIAKRILQLYYKLEDYGDVG